MPLEVRPSTLSVATPAVSRAMGTPGRAACRSAPAGIGSHARAWRGDAVAVTKKALKAGEVLDGEGGYTVWGRAVPATASARGGLLPIGLAHRVPLRRDVAAGQVLRLEDVTLDERATGVILRRQMMSPARG